MDKIVVASKDDSFVSRVRETLKDQEFEIIGVSLPEDILKNLLMNEPRAVLLDFDKDFFKTYAKTKEKFAGIAKIPMIAFSKEGFVFDFIGVSRSEFTEFLSREFRPPHLISAMKRIGLGVLTKKELLEKAKNVAVEAKEKEKYKEISISGMIKGKLIVIADDEVENREFIKVILGKEAQIIESTDGADALNIITVKKPAVVILDTVMPNMNGFEVLKRIRQKPEFDGIFFIISSARTKDRDIFRNMLHKKNTVFIKRPFKTEDLKKAIYDFYEQKK